MERFNKIA